MSDIIEISSERYKNLLHSEEILNRLYAAGVDNWEWYGDALNNNDDESYEDIYGEKNE